MTQISFGNRAQFFETSQRVATVKDQLHERLAEVSSGQRADLGKHVSGDFSPLAQIERSLRLIGTYESVIHEADLFSSTTQLGLNSISDHLSELAPDLLSAASSRDKISVSVVATETHSRLQSTLSALNTRVAGRAIFSGTSIQSDAVVDTETLLSQIDNAILVAGATTTTQKVTVINTWFSAGGGFETSSYLGATSALSPLQVSDTDRVETTIMANDPAILETLHGLAIGAMVARGSFGTIASEQADVLQLAGESMLQAQSGLTEKRAEIGVAQGRIEDARQANTAARFGFESARSEITSVDIYDASAKLAEVEAQLEMIYLLTARLSKLKLSDYI